MEIERGDYEDAWGYLIARLEDFKELGTDIKVEKLLDLIHEILRYTSGLE